MIIEYLGHSSFLMKFGGGVSVVADPYDGVGYEMPSVDAEIVTCSHQHFDHNNVKKVSRARVVLDKSGRFLRELEEGALEIEGIDTFHDPAFGALRGENVAFKFTCGGLTVCHMGDIGEPACRKIFDAIGRVDVLMIPVGGTYTVDALGAKEYVEGLRPKIVIPMHFGNCGGTLDIEGVENFLNVMRDLPVERVEGEYTVDEAELSRGEKIVLMQRSEL